MSCARLIERLDELYEKGGRVETPGWKPLTNVAAPGSTDEQPVFLVRVEQGRQVLLNAEGQQVDVTPRMEVPMRVTLGMDDGAVWVVSRLEILS